MQTGVLPGGQVGRAQRRLSGLLTCAVIRASPTTMSGRSSSCSTLLSCVGRMVALFLEFIIAAFHTITNIAQAGMSGL